MLISNKYHFSSYESWATSTITNHCLNNGSPFLGTCSPDTLSYALDVSVVCNFQTLRIAVQNVWIRRLKSDGLPVVDALKAGEKHGLRDFQGMAYYNQLQIMNSAKLQPAPGSTSMLYTDPSGSLTVLHKLRLYAGYWSLSKYWDHFSTCPAPTLPRSNTCQTLTINDECSRTWSSFWKNALARVSSMTGEHAVIVDVLEKLELLQKEFESPTSTPGHFPYHYFGTICCNCKVSVKSYVAKLRDELQSTLGDHFLGARQG